MRVHLNEAGKVSNAASTDYCFKQSQGLHCHLEAIQMFCVSQVL